MKEKDTNSHDDVKLKECSHCIFMSVILFDSIFKISKNYHPQVFQKNANTVSKKKINKYINNDQEISSDDSVKEDCNKEKSEGGN